jgi:demethylmenaquinone methyltransferase/2-methoxy-6-polyprenyl-1,4-benzoquinol methylase
MGEFYSRIHALYHCVRMDKLAAYYARRAAEYERIYAKPERQADLRALEARIRHMLAGRKVLELACGTGYWTDLYAPDAAQVTALDVNEEMLEIARSKKNARKVDFVRGSAYEIPDFGRTHDALFAGFWWSHVQLEKLDPFLESISPAIRPGGLIAFLDNRYVEGSSTPVSRRDADGNTYQARKLDDGSSHEVLKNFPAEGELIRRVSRHGWGANVDLFQYYWLLSFWAPK